MLRSERFRNLLYQALLLAAVVGIGWYLFSNTQHNLQTRQIQTGFDYLSREAGFEIAEKQIEYQSSDSYGRAFLVGLGNTLLVAGIGVILATLLGTLVGIARLSPNWLLSKIASSYVEVMRNVPLLLQLFVWYGLFTELLPSVNEAIAFGDWLFISQRGFRYAWPAEHPAWSAVGWGLLAGIALAFGWKSLARRRQLRTGLQWPVAWPSVLLIAGVPLLAWALMGAPTEIDRPVLEGFDFLGGKVLSPEFAARKRTVTVLPSTGSASLGRAALTTKVRVTLSALADTSRTWASKLLPSCHRRTATKLPAFKVANLSSATENTTSRGPSSAKRTTGCPAATTCPADVSMAVITPAPSACSCV